MEPYKIQASDPLWYCFENKHKNRNNREVSLVQVYEILCELATLWYLVLCDPPSNTRDRTS